MSISQRERTNRISWSIMSSSLYIWYANVGYFVDLIPDTQTHRLTILKREWPGCDAKVGDKIVNDKKLAFEA